MTTSLVEPRDPREHFAKPPFPQGKQTGPAALNKLVPG
jgi:hypothetical protein